MEVIVRAVLAAGNEVLLARVTGDPWFFLPGGHVEPGETAAAALRRELAEELGIRDLVVGDVLAIIENRYPDSHGDRHELNLVFDVSAPGVKVRSREPHLEFQWVERSRIHELDVRPSSVVPVLTGRLDGPRLRVLSDGFGTHGTVIR
jgi:8-oxo-dGTP diphosphatase